MSFITFNEIHLKKIKLSIRAYVKLNNKKKNNIWIVILINIKINKNNV